MFLQEVINEKLKHQEEEELWEAMGYVEEEVHKPKQGVWGRKLGIDSIRMH